MNWVILSAARRQINGVIRTRGMHVHNARMICAFDLIRMVNMKCCMQEPKRKSNVLERRNWGGIDCGVGHADGWMAVKLG